MSVLIRGMRIPLILCTLFSLSINLNAMEKKPYHHVYKDGKLWYLSNRSKPNSESIIRAYDGKTGMILFLGPELPVLNAKGLYVSDDGILSTYENCTNSLIEFKIEEVE